MLYHHPPICIVGRIYGHAPHFLSLCVSLPFCFFLVLSLPPSLPPSPLSLSLGLCLSLSRPLPLPLTLRVFVCPCVLPVCCLCALWCARLCPVRYLIALTALHMASAILGHDLSKWFAKLNVNSVEVSFPTHMCPLITTLLGRVSCTGTNAGTSCTAEPLPSPERQEIFAAPFSCDSPRFVRLRGGGFG